MSCASKTRSSGPRPPDDRSRYQKGISPKGFTPGGTATYTSLTALKMGLRPAIVTSAGPDLDLSRIPSDIRVHRVPSEKTTTFRNTYRYHRLTQFVEGVAAPISLSDVPDEARAARLVVLGPLADELAGGLAQGFSPTRSSWPRSRGGCGAGTTEAG